MSKADTLGPAPSFGAVRSARRNAISKIGGEDTTAAITELPVTVVSENPDNPRNHLRSLDETVDSVRELGVILPIVVATVEAYLHDRPDRAGDLDDGAQYVVVDGHRRLEASRRVGLAVIPVRVDNARVATDEALLEAAFVANYHRDDMTDLEEAHALKQLVEYYGSQTKAAKRLGIPQGTISSKLSLLKLSPELQKDLMAGERKVEHVRNLGKLAPEEQRAKADERAAVARQNTQAPPAQAQPGAPSEEQGRTAGPADYHGVIIPGEPTGPADGPLPPPVRQDSVPEPRPAGPQPPALPEERKPVMFPYDDGAFAAQLLIERMPAEEFDKMAGRVLAHHAQRRAGTG